MNSRRVLELEHGFKRGCDLSRPNFRRLRNLFIGQLPSSTSVEHRRAE